MTVLALLTPDGPALLAADAPLLRADDLGVLRGESVFETLRIAGGRPALLDAHLTRLAGSAARLAIELPSGWAELARTATEAFGQADGVLRLVCTKGAPGAGPTGFALVTPIPAETLRARADGVAAVTLTLGVSAGVRAAAPWLLGGVKATSYAVNMASLRAARGPGRPGRDLAQQRRDGARGADGDGRLGAQRGARHAAAGAGRGPARHHRRRRARAAGHAVRGPRGHRAGAGRGR